MTQLLDIGWRTKGWGGEQHYWRGRIHMRVVVSSCWLTAVTTQLKRMEDQPRCHICQMHQDLEHELDQMPETTA